MGNSSIYLYVIGFFGVVFLISIIPINLFKVAQYKNHLGVKLNVFLVLFQIARINRWLKTLLPKSSPSFESYYSAFAMFQLDGYTVLNPSDFQKDVRGEIIFVGQVIPFKEFKDRVNILLDKPLEQTLSYSQLTDVESVFNYYHLPYIKNMPKYDFSEVQRTDFDIYLRMKIFALGIAYIQATQTNNNQDKIFVLKEMKKTYDSYKEHFTKTDVKLFLNKLSEKEIMDYSWNTECLYELCYVCDVEKTTLLPKSPCTMNLYAKLVNINPDELKLNKQKALDMIDLYYSLLWTKREYALKGKKLDINEEIVTERYRALLWLFDKEPFDEIVCDT